MSTNLSKSVFKVFVGCIPFGVKKSDLVVYFSDFLQATGHMEQLRMHYQPRQGYAVIKLSSQKAYDDMVETPHLLNGQKLTVRQYLKHSEAKKRLRQLNQKQTSSSDHIPSPLLKGQQPPSPTSLSSLANAGGGILGQERSERTQRVQKKELISMFFLKSSSKTPIRFLEESAEVIMTRSTRLAEYAIRSINIPRAFSNQSLEKVRIG